MKLNNSEYFITWNFHDLLISQFDHWFADFTTLKFRDFAKVLDWVTLLFHVFEEDTINLTFYFIK